MSDSATRNHFISPAAFLAGAALLLLIASARPGSPEKNLQPIGNASVAVEWAEEVGDGVFIPACGSSSTQVTCQGGSPKVTFSWSVAGTLPPPPGVTCSTAAIKVNGNTIAGGLPCSGTYQWNSAAPNTTYSYQIVVETP